MFQTEYPFTLPRGYVDGNGTLHKDGVMRLATAKDEFAPLTDRRVTEHPEYAAFVLLARVITRLGTAEVTPETIESLFPMDMRYLQDLYERVNFSDEPVYDCQCPQCGHSYEVPLNFLRTGA